MFYSKQIFPLSFTILALALLGLNACIKKSDQDQSGPVAAYQQNQSQALLEPQPMKLCVRPAHRLGVKKCTRNGKWVRLNLVASDVDNDRIDVFSNPRLSLKKENFYLDTFRFQDGIAHVSNYPDYFHANATYGGSVHFIFAMLNQPQLAVTYGFTGRDEAVDGLKRTLEMMNPSLKHQVKVQHWNDGGTRKKFASIYFDILGDYNETKYRYECTWGESEQGFDYSQTKTTDGIEIPKIPETFIWRKISESCDQLPVKSFDGRFNYHPFRDVSMTPISTLHKFTLQNRNKIKIYSFKNMMSEEAPTPIDTLHPMALTGMKTDGSTILFLNSKKEEVSRWESIYEDDLKDESFVPERSK